MSGSRYAAINTEITGRWVLWRTLQGVGEAGCIVENSTAVRENDFPHEPPIRA